MNEKIVTSLRFVDGNLQMKLTLIVEGRPIDHQSEWVTVGNITQASLDFQAWKSERRTLCWKKKITLIRRIQSKNNSNLFGF